MRKGIHGKVNIDYVTGQYNILYVYKEGDKCYWDFTDTECGQGEVIPDILYEELVKQQLKQYGPKGRWANGHWDNRGDE